MAIEIRRLSDRLMIGEKGRLKTLIREFRVVCAAPGHHEKLNFGRKSMSAIEILGLCSAAYLVVIIVDAIRTRQFKRLLWQILIWVVAIVIALLYFQQTTGRIAFGDGPSRIVAISVTFVATLVGIAAHYILQLGEARRF